MPDAGERSQRSRQLPVACAQAAQQHKRQQQSQSDRRRPAAKLLSPRQPPSAVFAATPINNPGTVSQFGMRRLRRSVTGHERQKHCARENHGFKPAQT